MTLKFICTKAESVIPIGVIARKETHRHLWKRYILFIKHMGSSDDKIIDPGLLEKWSQLQRLGPLRIIIISPKCSWF